MNMNSCRKWLRALIACTMVLVAIPKPAFAYETGPIMAPLTVTLQYMANGTGAVYVQFQEGAMPGCYGDAGGYLLPGNTYFDELLAQLLTIIAKGGIRAQVLYTQNAPTNNWSDCTIEGLSLTPT